MQISEVLLNQADNMTEIMMDRELKYLTKLLVDEECKMSRLLSDVMCTWSPEYLAEISTSTCKYQKLH